MRHKNNNIITLGLVASLVLGACTDLEVDEKDSLVTQVGTFGGVDAAATLTSAYTDLRDFSNQENIYALLEVTSDELMVPTRGTDWGDNGIWRSLHQHTWTDQHQYVLNTWNNLNRNVYKLNQVLANQSNPNDQQKAEAKFLRAFNMWYVLDLYRQVPFRGPLEGVDVSPKVLTVDEALTSITDDLTAAVEGLPAATPGTGTSTIKATKAAANFMLAKVYLNRHIYLKQPNADPADMAKVIQHVDAITASGFGLEDDYFSIFKDASNSETIFWTDASWGNRIWNTLHYHHKVSTHDGGGWNGFSTTAEFYALFEGDPNNNEPGMSPDTRRGFVINKEDRELEGVGYGFLVGQQYDSMGQPFKDRPGNPLIFTKELANPTLTGNNERHGIRVIKYHPRWGSFNTYYVLARYADAFLMKIEALLRTSVSDPQALIMYNQLRVLRGATPVATVTLNDILNERGRELYIEGWRRNDQVRFGTFTKPFPYKDVVEEHRNVFPIPANALSTNPNLVPTEGY